MKIAIIGGRGAVGVELTNLLADRKPLLLSSQDTPSFSEIDYAFFCTNCEISQNLIPKALESGTRCIDASTAFRTDPGVPLVIPEINGHLLDSKPPLVASPNCTTTLMLLPLAPLHKNFVIKRIVATTYQAVSGAGYRGIEELATQIKDERAEPSVFPKRCAFNVFPHESPLLQNGYNEEEMKMRTETQKILDTDSIGITARCIRVPVFRTHSLALNVEMMKPFSLEDIEEILMEAPGVEFQKGISALDAAEKKSVFCGNLRKDPTRKNTLELWVCGDQLLKGAALNMAQIFELACQKSTTKRVSGGFSLR